MSIKMVFGEEVWSSEANVHLDKLKRTQNSVLRLCLGCPKTTPSHAMEIKSILCTLILTEQSGTPFLSSVDSYIGHWYNTSTIHTFKTTLTLYISNIIRNKSFYIKLCSKNANPPVIKFNNALHFPSFIKSTIFSSQNASLSIFILVKRRDKKNENGGSKTSGAHL